MKPYVICHMNASVDGRILGSRWRPAENRMPGLFERLHEQLGGDSWLIGRVTGSEYAKAGAYPAHSDQAYPHEPWVRLRDADEQKLEVRACGQQLRHEVPIALMLELPFAAGRHQQCGGRFELEEGARMR